MNITGLSITATLLSLLFLATSSQPFADDLRKATKSANKVITRQPNAQVNVTTPSNIPGAIYMGQYRKDQVLPPAPPENEGGDDSGMTQIDPPTLRFQEGPTDTD